MQELLKFTWAFWLTFALGAGLVGAIFLLFSFETPQFRRAAYVAWGIGVLLAGVGFWDIFSG